MRLPVTHRLRRARIFFKTTAVVIIIAFLGLYLQPLAIAAHLPKHKSTSTVPKETTDEEKLANTLEKIEKKLERLEAKLAKAQDASLEKSDLKKLHTQLVALDKKAMANFNKIEQHLKDNKLPQVILDRHYEAVATYKAELKALRDNLDAVEVATTDDQRRTKAYKAKEHLKRKRKKRKHTPLDPNNLPLRVPDGKVRKPAETKEEFQSLGLAPPKSVQVASSTLSTGMLVAQAAPPPGPEDLAPTEDVQITLEIQVLADSLDNNPVKIFNWVHDNIEFMPTYGSIQGSQMALETKRANAFDTSSLLIALLRASNIHARYVMGTVEIPVDKVMNWVGGVDVPEAALQVLGQGGVPNTGIAQGGKIVAVRLEHVWVEAFVDFIPSRGALHKQGDSWIPMDGSFKQYQFVQGIDVQSAAPLQVDGIIDQFAESGEINESESWATGFDISSLEQALDSYQSQIETGLQSDFPGATVTDVIGTQTIESSGRSILSKSLPYVLVLRGGVSTALQDALRYRFQFKVYGSALDQSLDSPLFIFDQSLPSLVGKDVTFTFSPENPADRQLLDSFIDSAASSVAAYLVRLKAEVRVDGEVLVDGGSFTMGHEVSTISGLIRPARGFRPISRNFVAGEVFAIGFDYAGTSSEQMTNRNEDIQTLIDQANQDPNATTNAEQSLGNLLHSTSLAYFGMLEAFTELSAGAADIVRYRLPSYGMEGTSYRVNHLFGLPRTVSMEGVLTDIVHSENIVEPKNGDAALRQEFTLTTGKLSSMFEHQVPDLVFSEPNDPVDSVSAVKLLSIANQQGMRIYQVDETNVATVLANLTIDQSDKEDIATAVSAGNKVIVHQDKISVGAWTGVGYVISDPLTGSGSYRISGGANGGVSLLDLLTESLSHVNNQDGSFLKFGRVFRILEKVVPAFGIILNIASINAGQCNLLAAVATALFFAVVSQLAIAILAAPGIGILAFILISIAVNFVVSKIQDFILNTSCAARLHQRYRFARGLGLA